MRMRLGLRSAAASAAANTSEMSAFRSDFIGSMEAIIRWADFCSMLVARVVAEVTRPESRGSRYLDRYDRRAILRCDQHGRPQSAFLDGRCFAGGREGRLHRG